MCIRDRTQIPQPSAIFVFLDEHPDSINDGYFIDKPAYPTLSAYGGSAQNDEWIDLPGSYHNGAGSFSFADGHTELHPWRNAGTCPPSVAEGANLPMWIAPD